MYNGNNEITSVYLGSEEITKIYQGNTVVYQKEEPSTTGYLQFGANAYIDTNIVPDLSTKVEVYMSAATSIPTYSVLFGSCNSEGALNWYRVRTESDSIDLNAAVDGDRRSVTISYPIDGTITLTKDRFELNCTDGRYYSTSLSPASSDIGTLLSLYVGADHRPSGAVDSKGGFTLGEMKIWKNNVLVADLIPSPENGGCYYDAVNDEYRLNEGSGTITYVSTPSPTPWVSGQGGIPTNWTRVNSD